MPETFVIETKDYKGEFVPPFDFPNGGRMQVHWLGPDSAIVEIERYDAFESLAEDQLLCDYCGRSRRDCRARGHSKHHPTSEA